MAGLFGTSTQAKPSLFGSSTTNQQSSGLFGQPAQPSAGGLFGSTQAKPPGSGLFGTSTTTNTSNATGGGLFGTAQPQQTQQSSGLFGSTNQPQQSGGLFGSTNQQGGGLFGSTNQSQQQQQQSGGLFGSTNQQQPQQNGGLFGGSLLSSQQPAQQQQQQQQNQQTMGFGTSIGASVNNSSVWNPNQSIIPREKPVASQMETLIAKWNPQSQSCVFQHYFYNQVTEEQAPYYSPGPFEDEQKWEEALKDKPTPGSIPVLARGPVEVGKRLEVQALCLRGIQSKLHELNDVLTKRLQAHDIQYSVRAAEARRKHIVLSRRALALATKVQVLRNKGYTLDTNEEQLKAKINGIWDEAFDPVFSGRQEEIWARLSVLRERAGQLQKEADDLSKEMNSTKESKLDPSQIQKVERILGTYEAQLNQLKKERDSAEKDFVEWQKSTATR